MNIPVQEHICSTRSVMTITDLSRADKLSLMEGFSASMNQAQSQKTTDVPKVGQQGGWTVVLVCSATLTCLHWRQGMCKKANDWVLEPHQAACWRPRGGWGVQGCPTGSHTTSLAILGRHLHAICRYMAPEPTADGEPALEGLTEYPSDQVCEPVTPWLYPTSTSP